MQRPVEEEICKTNYEGKWKSGGNPQYSHTDGGNPRKNQHAKLGGNPQKAKHGGNPQWEYEWGPIVVTQTIHEPTFEI